MVHELPAMIGFALAGVLLSAAPDCGGDLGAALELPVAGPDSLERLYSRGQTFAEFLTAAKSRREAWLGNYAAAAVSVQLLKRARAVPGRWRLLIVADDWCGDSVNTIPYLARLADSLPAVELRIVTSRDGRWVMERHRTPDGRAATPTVVLLDSTGAGVGCFVERPAALREWLEANRPRLSERGLQQGRDAWRRRDGGQATVREVVELLEAAARGRPLCGPTS
jgi:thioredoxin family protein